MTVTALDDLVNSIVEVIVQSAHPEKVILFGSRAEGGFTEDSDYDFLIVIRDVKNEREVSRMVNRAILDKQVGVPVDIVVVNEEKLRTHQNSPYYIYKRALSEGIVYYERPRAG
jgi:predicted nucleotidyltransferase